MTAPPPKKIFVGSRKSELALIQTRYVIASLKALHPEREFEIVTMSTLGDRILDIPLPKIGEKSLFTKELEASLDTGCVDFVVHSLKDLPTQLPDGMAIGAVLKREDPRDALVMRQDCSNETLASLPKDSVIGTSSLRRHAQLSKKYPHLKVENIRGNLNTRLQKLDDLNKFHGIILAAAGLVRMGWTKRITKILDSDEILYAVGQGALAVECRANDEEIIKLLQPLYDLETAFRVITERSFLKTLGGGCSAPVAITSELKQIKNCEYELCVKGAVWSLNGQEEIMDDDKATIFLRDDIKCAACPYNNNKLNNIEDIECFKHCAKYPESPVKEPQSKKMKTNKIAADLLKEDPHEQCPVQIPVGADFMGKCPYLEGELAAGSKGKCPVNGAILGKEISSCPFLKSGQLANKTILRRNSNNQNVKLYCGLVGHKAGSENALEEVQQLGVRLAEKLIEKGALVVMKGAQDIIHASTNAKS